jgi:hypothetical protein
MQINIIIHPEKLVHTNPAVNSIIKGWNRHLDIDRYFHSSDFFLTHSHNLKMMLVPAIKGSPVKPFFLGHVALELILDNLLLTTGKMTADSFYDHLEGCEEAVVNEFLNFAGLKDTATFFDFFKNFKTSRYLFTYSETKEIAYALRRICMRIWTEPFSPENEIAVNEVVIAYRESLRQNFIPVFDEICQRLN